MIAATFNHCKTLTLRAVRPACGDAFDVSVLILIVSGMLGAIALGLSSRPNSFPRRYLEHALPEFTGRISYNNSQGVSLNPAKLPTSSAVLATFNERYKLYRSSIDTVQVNFRYQLILIIASLLLCRYQSVPTVGILGISFDMPRQALLLLIPLILVWLHTQFGYTLDNVLSQRIVLSTLADRLQELLPNPDPNLPPSKDVLGEYRLFALGSILDDGGFVDFWCVYAGDDLRQTVAIKNRDTAAMIIASIVLFMHMSVYGIAHGCVVVIAREFRQSLASNFYRFCASVLTVLLIIYLFFTHYTFAYSGGNQNWGQYAILATWILSYVAMCHVANTHRVATPTTEDVYKVSLADTLDMQGNFVRK